MSVVFSYIDKNKVYLAADNRKTDADGNFVSDDDVKIAVVNNNAAVAFAGNCGAQSFFMNCYKEMRGYENWFVNELASNIVSMCDAIIKMDIGWARQIADSIAYFLVAGKTVGGEIKLFAITLKKRKIEVKDVQMMLYQPIDCGFEECANILCKNIKQYPNDFSKRTIHEISKISRVVSDSGNMWSFDIQKDESKFVDL